MKIRLIMLGKTRGEEIRSLLEDYLRRIRRYCDARVSEVPESSAGRRRLKIEPGAMLVLLDAGGREFTSRQFALWLGELRGRGVRELVFLCGAAEGFPKEWSDKTATRLSLSSLTMPHELARVMLVEQIYRAFTLLAGHPYAK